MVRDDVEQHKRDMKTRFLFAFASALVLLGCVWIMVNFEHMIPLVESLLTSVAILIGSIWSYHIYKLHREDKWNVRADAKFNFIDYGKDHKILYISLILENVGKIKVNPDGMNICAQYIPKNLVHGSKPHWDDSRESICHDILRDSNPKVKSNLSKCDISELYVLEPGCQYQECVNMVVKSNEIMMFEIELRHVDDDKGVYFYYTLQIPE